MALRNSPYAYGTLARAFHWLTVLFVTVAWMIGLFHDALPKGSPERAATMMTHFSLGFSVVALLVMRILWRFADPAPAPVATPLGRLGDISAAAIHGIAYLLLLAVPILGALIVFTAGRPIPLFGLIQVPPPEVFAACKAAGQTLYAPETCALIAEKAKMLPMAHEWLANGLMAVAFVHALAALVHQHVFHDRTLTRMLGRA